MKVLVTGGAGFIGSNYVHYHLAKKPGDELTVLDALTYSGNRSNLSGLDLDFREGRIEDREFIQKLFREKKFDSVIHFAAESHVDRSIVDPGIFVRTNVLGTQVLLDAAKELGLERFHHISTDEVYGDLGFGSTEKFTESSPLLPSSPYSASKASSDLLCLAYKRTFGVPVTISRCSNNYGPFQSTENFIPRMITLALNNERLQVYGAGENIRDWLFVQDHCDAILNILLNGEVGEIYNIGGNSEEKNLNVAKKILQILGKDENSIDFIPDRKGHDERYAVDFSKIENKLAWQPKVSFEEGLERTVQWYKLSAYERNYSRWWNGDKTLSSHKSYK